MDITSYVSGITANISNQTAAKSIPASTVGQGYIDLANLTKTNIESVNALATGNTLALSGATTANTLSITNLQTSVSGLSSTVTGFTAQIAAKVNTSAILVTGKNLLNPADLNVAVGYYLAGSGALTSNSTYNTSGFIPVTSGQTYTASPSVRFWEWYTAASTGSSISISAFTLTNATLTAPSTANYCRVTYNNSTWSTSQFELGSSATTFAAYGNQIISSLIPSATIADGSVTTSKLVTGAVTPLQTNFIQKGSNLFNILDPDCAISFFVNYTTGVLTASSGSYNTTGYIPVSAGQQYTMSDKHQIAYYNASKVYVSGDNSTGTTQTVPTGAAYVRCSVSTPNWSVFMFNTGSTALPYTAFQYQLQGVNGELITTQAAPIADASITPQKTTFLQKSNNLFNISDPNCAISYFVAYNTGILTAASGSYNTTGYIPVVPGQQYTMSDKHQIAYYNLNQVYISGDNSSTGTTQTVPSGAAYVRCSVSTPNWLQFMFNTGATLLPYVGFQYQLLSPDNGTVSAPNPGMAYPANLYLLGGYQNTIYFQHTVEKWKPYNFTSRIEGNALFINESNKVRITNPVTEGTVTANLYDDNFNIAASKSLNFLIGSQTKNNGTVNIITIGDSWSYNGSYLAKAVALCPALVTNGTRHPYSATTLNAEARGGWALNDYFTAFGTPNFGFTPFMQPADPYKYWGSTEFWSQASTAITTNYFYGNYVNASGFSSSTGLRLSPATNDMMYDSTAAALKVYNGTSWVTTTATTSTFTFNFAKYRSVWGITQPNVVTIMLGINDFVNCTTKAAAITAFAAYKTQMDTVIASVHADSPAAKFVIMIPPTFVGNPDNDSGNFTARLSFIYWQIRKLLIDTYDNRQSELIYVVDAGSAVDPDYGFVANYEVPFQDYTNANNTNPATPVVETRKVITNSPHPSNQGYAQVGVVLSAFIQKTRA